MSAKSFDESEDIDVRRKRLVYRANHRGTKELDLIIGGFAKDEVAALDADELTQLEMLLDEEETELQQWLMGQADYADHPAHALISRIRAHQLRKVGPGTDGKD